MTIKSLLVVASTVFATAMVSAQSRGTTAAAAQQKPGPSVNLYADLDKALDEGRFVDQGAEFKLDHPLTFGAPNWDTTIEFQIGTRDGKPVFVPVAITPATRAAVEKEITSTLPKLRTKNQFIQMCSPDSEQLCVETRDGQCFRYICVPRKK
jgi:hypothetical protein